MRSWEVRNKAQWKKYGVCPVLCCICAHIVPFQGPRADVYITFSNFSTNLHSKIQGSTYCETCSYQYVQYRKKLIKEFKIQATKDYRNILIIQMNKRGLRVIRTLGKFMDQGFNGGYIISACNRNRVKGGLYKDFRWMYEE